MYSKSWLFTLIVGLLNGGAIFPFVQENYEFPFEIISDAAYPKKFIQITTPSHTPQINLRFYDGKQPVLVVQLLAEDPHTMAVMKNRMFIRRDKDITAVHFMKAEDYGDYHCRLKENGVTFSGGGCFQRATLFLPLNLDVSIYQNESNIYTRAEVQAMKRQQFPETATPAAKKQSTEAKLKELNSMLKKGLITKEEYAEKKKALLDGM